MRMLSRQGNPQVRNLFEIISHLLKVDGASLRLEPIAADSSKAA
jgi:hypothetical protein